MPSAAQCPADDRIICTHRNMAEKDIEKLCLKERVDLSDKKTRTKWSADEETCHICRVGQGGCAVWGVQGSWGEVWRG